MVEETFRVRPVRIRDYLRLDVILVVGIFIVGFGAKVWVDAADDAVEIRLLVPVLFGILVVMSAILILRQGRRSGAVRLTERGVEITKGRTTHAITWHDLTDFRMSKKDIVLNQKPLGSELAITIGTDRRRFSLHHFEKGETNPFAPVVASILERLSGTRLEAVTRGGSIEGRGWRLDQNGLSVGHRTHTWQLLAPPEWQDDRLTVWAEDEDAPVLDIENAGRNAYLLHATGEALARGRPSASSRGRLLCVKRAWPALETVLFALLPAMVPLFMILLGIILEHSVTTVIGAVLLAVVVTFTVREVSRRARFYERHVTKQTLFGSTSIDTSQLVDFVLEGRQGGGLETRTHFRFSLTEPGGRSHRISVRNQIHTEWAETVALAIARAMQPGVEARLDAGEAIPLGLHLSLTRDRVRVLGAREIRAAGGDAFDLDELQILSDEPDLLLIGFPEGEIPIPKYRGSFWPGRVWLDGHRSSLRAPAARQGDDQQ